MFVKEKHGLNTDFIRNLGNKLKDLCITIPGD